MKITKLLFLGLFIISIAACGKKASDSNTAAVGSDKDEHGCIGSAGYSWSTLKNECIRVFESGVRLNAATTGMDTTVSAFVVFKSTSELKEVEIFLPSAKGSSVLQQVSDTQWSHDNLVLNAEGTNYTLTNTTNKEMFKSH